MASRMLRRTFAAPFVVTLAAGACGSSNPPPPQKPPQQPHENPPPPEPPKEPTAGPVEPGPGPGDEIHRNPPPPDLEPVDAKPEPAKYERHWTVMRNNNKDAKPTDCFAFPEANCPKPEPGKAVPTCNPPPPAPYVCPDGFSKDTGASMKIVLRAGATECFVDYGPQSCPKGATCNPPPPRKMPCPH